MEVMHERNAHNFPLDLAVTAPGNKLKKVVKIKPAKPIYIYIILGSYFTKIPVA
eukprot:gene28907-50814_t